MRAGHRIAAVSVLALALAACSSSTRAGPTSTPETTAGAPTTASVPATRTSTGPPSTPGAPAGSVAAPRCRSAQLTPSLGPPEGAAGSVYRVLIFTNTGSQACAMQGFPGVSYVAGDVGQQVGPAAERVGDAGGSVRIAPGATASAQLQLVNVAKLRHGGVPSDACAGLAHLPPGRDGGAVRADRGHRLRGYAARLAAHRGHDHCALTDQDIDQRASWSTVKVPLSALLT